MLDIMTIRRGWCLDIGLFSLPAFQDMSLPHQTNAHKTCYRSISLSMTLISIYNNHLSLQHADNEIGVHATKLYVIPFANFY